MKHITLIHGIPAARLACNIITEQVKSAKINSVRISAYGQSECRELLEQHILGKGHIVYAFINESELELISQLKNYGFNRLCIIHNPHEYFQAIREVNIDIPSYMHGVLDNNEDVFMLLDFFDNHRTFFARQHDIVTGIMLLPALREYRTLTMTREQSRQIRNCPMTIVKDVPVYYLVELRSIRKDAALAHFHDRLGGDVAYVSITRNYVVVNLQHIKTEEKAVELLAYFNAAYAYSPSAVNPKVAKMSVRATHSYKRNDELDSMVTKHLLAYTKELIA